MEKIIKALFHMAQKLAFFFSQLSSLWLLIMTIFISCSLSYICWLNLIFVVLLGVYCIKLMHILIGDIWLEISYFSINYYGISYSGIVIPPFYRNKNNIIISRLVIPRFYTSPTWNNPISNLIPKLSIITRTKRAVIV